jgi:hypothetical protein
MKPMWHGLGCGEGSLGSDIEPLYIFRSEAQRGLQTGDVNPVAYISGISVKYSQRH